MAVKGLDTYCNPFWQGSFPDPFILKVRGHYYAYATEQESHLHDSAWVFPVMTSKDLVQWREIGKAMPALGRQYNRYWAPEVIEDNGQFYLYYAVHTTEFSGSIRVAVADRPEGPFKDSGRDLTAHLVPWAIDPHVFRDSDGQRYLYMTIEYWDDPTGYTGSGNAVDRLIDPFTLEGQVTRVTPPSHAWQLFEARRKERGGVDWYTVEGPAVIKHRKRYYEMFSGGCYYRDNYAVSYATAKMPKGPGGMQDTTWHDWEGREGNTLLLQGDGVHLVSPGHNSLVLGPDNVTPYIVYHARQKERTIREPYLDRLFWHGDTMWTPAPTYTPQPAPALPRLHELFETPDLQSWWQPNKGRWRIVPGEVVQEGESVSRAILRYQDQVRETWLLEVNLRYIAGEGVYGVLLHCSAGITIFVVITLDARLQIWVDGEFSKPVKTVSLPANTTITVWHQLLITASGSLYTVRFDGLPLLEFAAKHKVNTFSLFTDHCCAAFSGISLTDHYRDEFLDDQHTPALLGWEAPPGAANKGAVSETWHIQDGALEQTGTLPGEQILLKGPTYLEYEFGVTMRLHRASEQAQPAYGVVSWHNAERCLFVRFQKKSVGWVLVVENAETVSPLNKVVELPDTFDPATWHTLRIVRQDERLTIYLDGPEVLAITLPLLPERVGLVTCDAGVAFTGVWQTGFSIEGKGMRI
jgi:arabinan endo-1,5-alpha-L-arabinosidase